MPPSKTEMRIGLSPAFLRIAYYYLRLGEGEYTPDGGHHPHYDKVIVRELYEFGENPAMPGEYAGGMTVVFYKDGHRLRFVEFRCQVVGGGGYPIMRSVD